jgi:uracil-DNA glycosylase
MIVTHRMQASKTPLVFNYGQKCGFGWCTNLRKLFSGDYMTHLQFYIQQLYKSGALVYPSYQEHIFAPLTESMFSQVKVVIFGDEPKPNVYSNGLAFATYEKTDSVYDADTVALKTLIEHNVYDGSPEKFDVTLKSWAEQGVMLLNICPVTQRGTVMEHAFAFRQYIREIVKALAENDDIIFVFTSKKQDYFKKFLDEERHLIITVDGITGDPELFTKINERLIDTDGEGADIQW